MGAAARADALAMQEADVLVETHGAALVNALFMRRGGALLEVRPYNFDGAWPDRYHLAMAQRENATHAFVVAHAQPLALHTGAAGQRLGVERKAAQHAGRALWPPSPPASPPP